MDFTIKQGQLITLTFEGKSFEVIVIDPNGLGKGQPCQDSKIPVVAINEALESLEQFTM